MRQRKIRALSIIIALAACIFAFSNAALARGEYTADNVRLGGTAGIYRDTEVDNNNFTAWATDAGEAYSGLTIHAKPNESVKLSVSVKADDTTGITYRWKVRQYDHQTGEMSGQTVVENATSATYTVKITGRANYTCYVTDRYGTTREVYFYIYVDNNFNAWATLSDVHIQDWIITVDLNGSAEMSVTADATDTTGITYTWFFMRYNETHNYWGNELIENAVSATYTANGITEKAKYVCKVSDRYGNEKWVYFHIFISNNFEAWATDSTARSSVYYCYVIPNTSAKLSVSVDATDTTGITYQWHREQTGSSFYNEIEGATSSTYTTGQIKTEEEYYCKVTDKYGTQKGVWIHVIPWEKELIRLTSANVEFKGLIRMRMAFLMTEDLHSRDDVYVAYYKEDGTIAAKIPLKDGEYLKDQDGLKSYGYYCPVRAKEFADNLYVKVIGIGGKAMEYSTSGGGWSGTEYVYSTKMYADAVLASSTTQQTMKNVATAFLDYGAAANIRFADGSAGYSVSDKVTRVTWEEMGESASYDSGKAKAMGVEISLNLDFLEDNSLYVYFTLPNGKTVSDYTFTFRRNGTSNTVTPIAQGGNKYLMKVGNIAARKLAEFYDITITEKSNSANTFTVHVSALSYAKTLAYQYEGTTDPTKQKMLNLVKSLYLYWKAAAAHWGTD